MIRRGRFANCLAHHVERGISMKRFVRFIATADTLELKDGRVLQGRYLGGTQAVLRFEVNGNIQTFNINDAVALTFTNGGSASAPPPPAPVTAPALAPRPVVRAAEPIPAGGTVTIPAGQSILVR